MRQSWPMKGPRFAAGCQRGHARGAFSLVELLIVMTVAAIIMTIALPRIDRTRMEVNSQDQVVRGAMMMAQRLAVTRGYNVIVTFDTAGRTLRVQEDPDGDMISDAGERVTGTKLEGGVRFSRGAAPAYSGVTADISFRGRQASLPAMVYHRDGSASEAGVFYITSTRSTGSAYPTDTRAFSVEHSTGRVLGFKYDGSVWRREM